ncbi:hypothetical protein [Salinisphaera aquimarina]|uniref:Uncharacterized protein n=1 Tax=Salinisphaera aquimarina TaxID=2094031 RepID=A0ABV7ERH2_9GAMM
MQEFDAALDSRRQCLSRHEDIPGPNLRIGRITRLIEQRMLVATVQAGRRYRTRDSPARRAR